MERPGCFGDDVRLASMGEDRYQAVITDRWWIVIGPNGGLLAALIVRAASESMARRAEPSTTALVVKALTVQFLSAPVEGTVTLAVTANRVGRRVAVLSVEVTQDDRLLCLGRVTMAAPQGPMFDARDLVMPAAPPASATPAAQLEAEPKNSRLRWDVRPVFFGEKVDDTPGLVSGGWLRLDPPEPVDASVLALMADNWTPSIRGHLHDDRLHTITLEYHVYVRGRSLPAPAQDHVLVLLRSATSIDGYHQEDAEIWAADGELLATARQLALVFRRPDDPG